MGLARRITNDKRRTVLIAVTICACSILGLILGLTLSRKKNDSTTLPDTQSPTQENDGCDPNTTCCFNDTENEEGSPPLHLVTYQPGLLNEQEEGLYLSQGLTAKVIAQSGNPVTYRNGQVSKIAFHDRPDFGATFPDVDPENEGGWIYVSNSEMRETGDGGVGAITFDKYGNMLNYQMLLTNTTMNCGGGRTPWNTWISCEEVSEVGQIYQVDPTGVRMPEKLTMGLDGDPFESFAFDDRNPSRPYFFTTADRPKGALRRFTPDIVNWADPWSMLHMNGTLEFLYLMPEHNSTSPTSGGTFEWIKSQSKAKENAKKHFPSTEAIDRVGDTLYFVSKKRSVLYILNLDTQNFTRQSTVHGLFGGHGDQIQRILANDDDNDNDEILYFTEEDRGGGIHGRNGRGRFFTIVEGNKTIFPSESTGLAFSPDGCHMYFAYQDNGTLFDVTRKDRLPFHGRSLDVRYHNHGIRRYL